MLNSIRAAAAFAAVVLVAGTSGAALAQGLIPPGTMQRHAQIYAAAKKAMLQKPADWDWNAFEVTPDLKQSVIDAGYTPEELRNVYTALAMQADERWPSGHRPPPRPPSTDSTPFGMKHTMPTPGQDPLQAPDFKFGGRGFKGMEHFYGSNGYLMNSTNNRVNTVNYMIAKKDRVYFRWVFTADHSGTFFGFPGGPGQTVAAAESAYTTWRDGKMTSGNFAGDDLSLYSSLGGKLTFPNGGVKAP